MLHRLLALTRPLFIVDCETTGVNTSTDRVVELGFERWESSGMTRVWSSRINPGVPIPEVVTQIHGITDTDVAQKPTFKQIAISLASGFSACDFAGKNVRFDLRILAAEFARVKVAWSYVGARIIDADRLEALAVPRHLSDLHKKYMGKAHDGAHGALSDVQASMKVIVMQLSTYDALPRDLDALHEMSWPGWLTPDGGVRLVNGVATLMFGKHRDKALRDVPRDYLDWILQNDFGPEMKTLASNAKLGKFPEVK